MSNITALNTYLEPFQAYFAMPAVSEICINNPGGIWIEQYGKFQFFKEANFDSNYLKQFARLVGEFNGREISPEKPTLSSVLPDGSRVQFVIEPACEKGSFICSIRRKAVTETRLEDYFKPTKMTKIEKKVSNFNSSLSDQQQLLQLYDDGNYLEFLKLAVLRKKNILISGGTSTGKTALLNELLKVIPSSERIITIETDREVHSSHLNSVHLLASEEGEGISDISMLELLKVALRLRPDRLLPSELRSEEAFSYLRAVNSGHPGSLSTIHADSPISAFEQLAFMAMQSGSHFSRQELLHYAKSVVNIIVQVKRIPNSSTRYISDIYFDALEELSSRTIPKRNIIRS